MSDEIQRILHGRLTVSLSDKHKYLLTDVDLKQWAICILRKNAHESFSLMFYILSKAIDGSWSATKSHTFNRDTTAVYSFLKANCLTTKILASAPAANVEEKAQGLPEAPVPKPKLVIDEAATMQKIRGVLEDWATNSSTWSVDDLLLNTNNNKALLLNPKSMLNKYATAFATTLYTVLEKVANNESHASCFRAASLLVLIKTCQPSCILSQLLTIFTRTSSNNTHQDTSAYQAFLDLTWSDSMSLADFLDHYVLLKNQLTNVPARLGCTILYREITKRNIPSTNSAHTRMMLEFKKLGGQLNWKKAHAAYCEEMRALADVNLSLGKNVSPSYGIISQASSSEQKSYQSTPRENKTYTVRPDEKLNACVFCRHTTPDHPSHLCAQKPMGKCCYTCGKAGHISKDRSSDCTGTPSHLVPKYAYDRAKGYCVDKPRSKGKSNNNKTTPNTITKAAKQQGYKYITIDELGNRLSDFKSELRRERDESIKAALIDNNATLLSQMQDMFTKSIKSVTDTVVTYPPNTNTGSSFYPNDGAMGFNL
jgi:hypothetical protein